MSLFSFESYLYLAIALVLLAVKIFALVSSLTFSAESYAAANKLNKPAWSIILGVGVLVQLLLASSPINFLNLAFTIAAFVYLADVRPALSSLTRRR